MTRLLLDAHALLWFVWNDARLSAAARLVIEDGQNQKLVSVATCWEIAIKCGLGKLTLGEPSEAFLTRELKLNNFEMLPISLTHATAVESLPRHHKDPLDRLLVVQAIQDSLSLVSADPAFDAYSVSRIW